MAAKQSPRSAVEIASPSAMVRNDIFVGVRSLSLAVLLALLLALLPLSALAQTPDAEVDFYVKEPPPPDQPYTVGDRITLRLEVTHPVDSGVVLPQLDSEWADFTVVQQTSAETIKNIDGRAVTGKDITVALFAPGDFQTPRLVITHRPPAGNVEELAAPVITIKISSVLTDDSELRDLKPQADLPVPPVWPWVVGGLLATMLVLGLLAGAGLWLHHRRQQRAMAVDAPGAPVDLRPPEEIAHTELDHIESLKLPARQQFKQHYSLVADCLRRYIEGRYHIPALEQTTGEIRLALRQADISVHDSHQFMTIFTESDLVKFARHKPDPAAAAGLVAQAREVVNVTTPPPPEETVDD